MGPSMSNHNFSCVLLNSAVNMLHNMFKYVLLPILAVKMEMFQMHVSNAYYFSNLGIHVY